MTRHPVRALALAVALAATPACTAFQLGLTRIENPIAAARTLDHQAYALLSTYAAVLEEAADIVADPAAPLALKRALGRAERVATPAAETLQIAVAAYVRARADYDAAANQNQAAAERLALALTIAADRLGQAMNAAKAPIAELQRLVRI